MENDNGSADRGGNDDDQRRQRRSNGPEHISTIIARVMAELNRKREEQKERAA